MWNSTENLQAEAFYYFDFIWFLQLCPGKSFLLPLFLLQEGYESNPSSLKYMVIYFLWTIEILNTNS